MTAQILVHVLLSLIGILTGFVVLYGLVTSQRFERWTGVFLASTIATSATGFLFPFTRLLPSHIVGIVSLVALTVAIDALYLHRLEGKARPTYVISAFASQYLNVFVLVVQLFLKVPALKQLAPTQTELPFAVTQGLVLAVFVAWGALATLRFERKTAFAGSSGRRLAIR